MLKSYRHFNYLSLDVAIGAALLSAAICNFLNDAIHWDFALCLGIAVWIIYTFDHLLDAHKSANNPSISRHLFHRNHAKAFSFIMLIATVLGWVLALRLASSTIQWGVILLGFVSLYFMLILFFKQFYLKEIFVAGVYALGVFLGPVSIYILEIDLQLISLFVQLLLIAFANLSLFSLIEYDMDIKDSHPSLARKIGRVKMEKAIKIILIMTVAIQAVSLVKFGFTGFQFLFLIMTILLSLVYKYAQDLIKNELYRWMADAIFFIPAIILLF